MIEFFVDRKRTALAFLLVLIVAGIFGRINIPVEAEPDITIPVVYAGVGLPGVSPSDSERLLVRPLEEELRSIEGVKKLQAFGFEGYAAAVVEFEAAETMSKSLDSVRDAVNEAKSKFKEIRPKTMGQALRIDGITPAAVYILLSHLKRKSIKHIA